MLVFVGMGLYDEKDISVKGLEEVRKADYVFAEFYTSSLTGTTLERIQEFMGKKIEVLSRDEVEDGSRILNLAENNRVVLLTPGDPMVATTHVSLALEAFKRSIETKIIHGASIVSAVCGLTGLHSYKFGRSATIPYPQLGKIPTSPYRIIEENFRVNAHTLLYLDTAEGPMSINKAVEILLEMERIEGRGVLKGVFALGIARAGSDKPEVKCDYLEKLILHDFGEPMHIMVIPSKKLHFSEVEALKILADAPSEIEEYVE